MGRSQIPKPKLFALVAGINDYPQDIFFGPAGNIFFPKLRGCVPDAEKFRDYLLSEDTFDLDLLLLTNNQVTKSAIVHNLSHLFEQAGPADTVVLYFSGHGYQELCDDAFLAEETDKKLEGIVCYYSKTQPEHFLLADKELRYLINRYATHTENIVMIFDCCHSGEITRAAIETGKNYTVAIEKQIAHTFPERGWEEFIFHHELERNDLKILGLEACLPLKKHVHIAACEPGEKAVEIAGEGVLTKILLRVLYSTSGQITYNNLESRLRSYMHAVYEQHPKIDQVNQDENAEEATFLGKKAGDQNLSGAEIILAENGQWLLNRGAAQGLTEITPLTKVFCPKNPSLFLRAKITAVGLDTSRVTVQGAVGGETLLYCQMPPPDGPTLKIFLVNRSEDILWTAGIVENCFYRDSRFTLVDELKYADLVMVLNRQFAYFAYPENIHYPITQAVSKSQDATVLLKDVLQHIFLWKQRQSVLNGNPQTNVPFSKVKVEISLGDDKNTFQEMAAYQQLFYKFSNGFWRNQIKIKITNRSLKKMYCAALYLTSDFSCTTGLLTPTVKILDGGAHVFLKAGAQEWITLTLDPAMNDYNLDEIKDYLKIIVSDEPFVVNTLSIKKYVSPRIGEKFRETRVMQKADSEITGNGWTVKNFTLAFQNPCRNEMSESKLSEMVNNPATQQSAIAIFFNSHDLGGAQKYEIKDEIILVDNDCRAISQERRRLFEININNHNQLNYEPKN